MTTNHSSGPNLTFGPLGYDPDAGPSMFMGGSGILDPRPYTTYYPGRATGTTGLYGATPILTLALSAAVNVIVNANSICAGQVPVAGTPMLLNGTGTGVTLNSSTVNAATGAAVTGLAAIGGVTTYVTFGANRWYNPTSMMTRCLQITSVGDDSGATFTVRGYDVYGYPMTETITGANATDVASFKAFKYVASVTPSGTLSGSNVSVGIHSRIGLPLYSPARELLAVYQNASGTPVAGGTYAPGSTTNPATATTGDVRGFYVPTTAQTLYVYQTILPENISGTTTTGLFGVAQYSDF